MADKTGWSKVTPTDKKAKRASRGKGRKGKRTKRANGRS